jgi:DNA-binding NarL/FixJ family response regulator
MTAQIRVLLADDSETLRRAVKAVLRSEPSIVLVGEACNYQELVAALSRLKVDVIVMDVHMPDSELVEPESIKAQLNTPLLAISFANDEGTANHAKDYGASRLLDKVELARTLVPAIKGCLQQKAESQGP